MRLETYQEVLENLFDGIYFVDLVKKITYWSRGAERITGYSSQEVLGCCCADNLLRHLDQDGKELCLEGCPLGASLLDGKSRDAEVFLHHKKGHRLPVRIRVIPVFDDAGQITGAVEIFQDTSSRSDLIHELESLRKETLLDELTGVGNRRMLDIALQEALENLQRENVPFGLVFLDIDHFKAVNDNQGHAVGDKVLRMVAKTISHLGRPLDTVTRYGGEEFAVVVLSIDGSVLHTIAERIRSFVEKSWLMVGGKKVQVTVSIGAVLARKGEKASEVLDRADTLLYGSKAQGRNRISIVAP